MTKASDYAELVRDRNVCHRCPELANPADVDGGRFDSDQIGAWSLWQGNLDASLMVVGQDWGGIAYLRKNRGGEAPSNPTNRALVELIGIAGVPIDEPGLHQGRHAAFFTNAVLCLKGGALQATVQQTWFQNCAPFLRRQIDIVRPEVVVGLGERAYRSILACFGMASGSFRSEVEAKDGRILPDGTCAFAVYHCGARIRNTHRKMGEQREDWRRIRSHIRGGRLTRG